MARVPPKPTSTDVPALLDAFEQDLEKLRALYQQYFMGIERLAPSQLHDRVKRAQRDLEALRPRNTAHRFRLQGLRARLITYEQYWTRILLQMERGMSRRDALRAAGRVLPPTAAAATPAADDAVATPESAEASGARAAARTRPAPAPAAAPELPPGMSAKDCRELFKQLVQAKRAAGEAIEGLTYGSLVAKLAREAPKLQERHGAAVKFEVATDGGKVRLRARPGSGA